MHTQRDIFTYTLPVTQCYIVIIAHVNSKTKALALVLTGLQQPTLPLLLFELCWDSEGDCLGTQPVAKFNIT